MPVARRVRKACAKAGTDDTPEMDNGTDTKLRVSATAEATIKRPDFQLGNAVYVNAP